MSRFIPITAASEQNKVSNSEVVEKLIPVGDFWMFDDDMYQQL